MDKKNILIKLSRKTIDDRAIVLKFRYETEVSNFLNLLRVNIPEFEYQYFYKLYNKTDNIFIKNIGNVLENKINEENFKMELVIVKIIGKINEIIEFMDNENSIINYKEELFSNIFNKIKKEG